MTELPVHDPAEALRVTGNRPEVAAHLLGLFLKELPDAQRTVAGLGASGEHEALRARVHRLAGSAMYCGALRLLDEAGFEGELVVRDVRVGRAEAVQMWGRGETARQEFRRLRAH